MKTKVKLVLSLMLVVLVAALFEACSKSDDPAVVIDKVALNAAITAASTLQTGAVEGKAAGQYQVGAKATFQTAIDASKTVAASTTATQTDVNNAVTALANAVTVFQGKIIAEIDPANLVAYWKFDEGTGTTVADASGNTRTGTLTVGHPTLAGGIPTWVADRKGTAAKALHFTKGGHVLVPANAAFSPAELSLSLWVYIDSLTAAQCTSFGGACKNGKVYADNYIISQNHYEGYKFQTQDDKYPFFTYKNTAGNYINTASGTNLNLKRWYHLAVTAKAAQLTFYINGLKIPGNSGDTPVGAMIALTDRWDFVIGQETPNSKTDNNITYVLPHMEGSLDDVRVYKTVLTDAQVSSIYQMEKP
jgi:hypothetical protein